MNKSNDEYLSFCFVWTILLLAYMLPFVFFTKLCILFSFFVLSSASTFRYGWGWGFDRLATNWWFGAARYRYLWTPRFFLILGILLFLFFVIIVTLICVQLFIFDHFAHLININIHPSLFSCINSQNFLIDSFSGWYSK